MWGRSKVHLLLRGDRLGGVGGGGDIARGSGEGEFFGR